MTPVLSSRLLSLLAPLLSALLSDESTERQVSVAAYSEQGRVVRVELCRGRAAAERRRPDGLSTLTRGPFRQLKGRSPRPDSRWWLFSC